MTGILNVIEKLIKKESDILKKFEDVYENKQNVIFTYFNQNSFNELYKNPKLCELFNEFVIYQEGIGMFMFFTLFDKWDYNRIDSTKVLEDFINFLISKDESVVFIGGNFEPSEFIERCKNKNFIIESYINGFFELNFLDNLKQKIKECKSRYIILGMGTPKQEIVALKLKQVFPDKTFICVGNFMNFFLGYQLRAPKLLRSLQLEWLFRLMIEPKRLFKRYVIGIPLFLFRVILLKFNSMFDKLSGV